MATRSRIGIEEKGRVRSIYCHYDGYPEGVGAVLSKHYQDADKVRELMELGDLSTLGAEIGEKQDFRNPNEKQDWCLAYGRDREETAIDSREFDSVFHWWADSLTSWVDYVYLYRDGKWFYWAIGDMPEATHLI